MEVTQNNNNKYMNLEATELRLGLPGITDSPADTNDSSWTKSNSNSSKRPFPEEDSGSSSTNISSISGNDHNDTVPPPPKAQIVGWPPIRSYRKNNLQHTSNKTSTDHSPAGYVKLSMDGAPYLRKIDLNLYTTYPDLLKAMEGMFKVTIGQYFEREGYNGSDYTPTYEDRDGDWMLVGDVPWTMFVSTCKRLRIMKSSEAKGLGRC